MSIFSSILSGIPVVGQALGGIADALGGAAKGSASGEQAGNDSMAKYDANQIAEQNAANQAAINNYLAQNNSATNLYNAQQSDYVNKNTIATKNPGTFARDSVLAGILSNTPTFNGGGHGSAITYTGPGDAAKADLAELQAQSSKNLAESPVKNPVPSANSVVSPTLVAAPVLAANPTLTKPTQPGSSLLDKILGGAGLATGVLGAFGGGDGSGGTLPSKSTVSPIGFLPGN